jgi:hypothetical protein
MKPESPLILTTKKLPNSHHSAVLGIPRKHRIEDLRKRMFVWAFAESEIGRRWPRW